MTKYLTISILLFVLGMSEFWLSYRKNQARFLNGILFVISMFFLVMAVCSSLLMLNDFDLTIFVGNIGIVIFALLLLYCLIQIVQWLSKDVVKWEKSNHRSLKMSLIGLVVLMVLLLTIQNNVFDSIVQDSIYLIFLYVVFVTLSIISASYLFISRKPKYDKDYIIIPSSEVNNEVVTSRMNSAIKIFKKQLLTGHRPPVLICSGDRSTSESMRQYMIDCGIGPQNILVGPKSKNEKDDIRFSRIIVSECDLDPQSGAIIGDENHLDQDRCYGDQVGLKLEDFNFTNNRLFIPSVIINNFFRRFCRYKKTNLIILLGFVIASIAMNTQNI